MLQATLDHSRPGSSRPLPQRSSCQRAALATCLCGFVVVSLMAGAQPAAADSLELGFIEEFALADDREAALEQLVPGSDTYYYFATLLRQQQGRLEEAEVMLERWRTVALETEPEFLQVEARQRLLTYSQTPGRTMEFLIDLLGGPIHDGVPAVGANEAKTLPSTISAQQLSHARFQKRAIDKRVIQKLGPGALARVEVSKLGRRELHTWLRAASQVPDHPQLVATVLQLAEKSPLGPTYERMTRTLLDECLAQEPELAKHDPFVAAYLQKFAAPASFAGAIDTAWWRAHCERLLAFTERVDRNPERSAALYRLLDFARQQGEYPKERFLQYLQIPRQRPYVPRRYLERHKGHRVVRTIPSIAGLPAVHNDWELVQDYLEVLLADAPGIAEYRDYIEADLLQQTFISAKLLAGVGDPDEWTTLPATKTGIHDPSFYQDLQQRVELTFAPNQRSVFKSDEDIALEVQLKRIPELEVRIYAVDALGHFLAHKTAVDAQISLDGLQPTWIHRKSRNLSAWLRSRETLTFPELSAAGTYVVDLVGGGVTSRALIIKGTLQHHATVTSRGNQVAVFDDQGVPVPGAVVWLDGHRFEADPSGAVVLPFPHHGAERSLILARDAHGTEATLTQLKPATEHYALKLRASVERETLIPGAVGVALLRPSLLLAQTPISVTLLDDVRVEVTAKNAAGTPTVTELRSVQLSNNAEAVVRFRVPEQLRSVSLRISGSVQSISTGLPIQLEATIEEKCNEIDASTRIQQLFLSPSQPEVDGSAFRFELRGKNGELLPHTNVSLSFWRRGYPIAIPFSLQTDKQGRVQVASLAGIDRVESGDQSWSFSSGVEGLPSAIVTTSPERLTIPVPAATTLDVRDVAFFELGAKERCHQNLHAKLEREPGCIALQGLAPGHYRLWLKEHECTIDVIVLERRVDRFLSSATRIASARPVVPAYISDLETTETDLVLQIKEHTTATRCHVTATHFVPEWNALATQMAAPAPRVGVSAAQPTRSTFLNSRTLGDEGQYIRARRHLRKRPGNPLRRPGLLLNPWAVGTTLTQKWSGQGPDQWEDAPEGIRFYGARGGRRGQRTSPSTRSNTSHDFLPAPGVVVANQRPDPTGRLTIPRQRFGSARWLTVVAVDARGASSRSFAIPGPEWSARDRRRPATTTATAPATPAVQRRTTELIRGGGELTFSSSEGSLSRSYQTLEQVFHLYRTLLGDNSLDEFEFITRWPQLDAAEKRRLYSEYSCHELNLFLAHKDPEFFATVIRPFITNKKEPSFVDRYLLEEDLSGYLEPWAYATLNALEKALLVRRFPQQAEPTRRHLLESDAAEPFERAELEARYDTALQGRAFAALILSRFHKGEEGGTGAFAFDGRTGGGFVMSEDDEDDDAGADFLGVPVLTPKATDQARRRPPPAEAFLFDEAPARELQKLHRPLGPTMEFIESEYYKVGERTPELIPPSAFWADYAGHRASRDGDFLSTWLHLATFSRAEALCALAVLDLPFTASAATVTHERGQTTVRSAGSAVVFHEELGAPTADRTPERLVTAHQRYVRRAADDVDRPVRGDFLVRTPYHAQVIVTNATDEERSVQVMVQTPVGSLPLASGAESQAVDVEIAPYFSKVVEYAFYFPEPGTYAHGPARVSVGAELLASTAPRDLTVVEELSSVDTDSWFQVSQLGSEEQVFDYLNTHSLVDLDLDLLEWRMVLDANYQTFGRRLLEYLTLHHCFNETLWLYAMFHGDDPRIQQLLAHCPELIDICAGPIQSPLLSIDAVDHGLFRQKEYAPLIHARAHPFGATRRILNQEQRAQYRLLLKQLALKATLDDTDRLTIAEALLRQDRLDAGLQWFAQVDRGRVRSQLQYDYIAAYVDLFNFEPTAAREIAARYSDYPVDSWRQRFAAVTRYLDEVNEAQPGPDVSDSQTPDVTAVALSFEIEGTTLTIDHQSVSECFVRYYPMDIEQLFSSQPFLEESDHSARWSTIRPALVEKHSLSATGTTAVSIAGDYRDKNAIIEVQAGATRDSHPHFASSLITHVAQRQGTLLVQGRDDRRPAAGVYVKVYRLGEDENVEFHKDGYTDLRGQFDYMRVSGTPSGGVERFAILVLDDERGAEITEVPGPLQ